MEVSVELEDDEGPPSVISVYFPNVVPVTEQMSDREAESLNKLVCWFVQSRLRRFGLAFDSVVRRGLAEHWAELDIALTTLATLLREGGLDGSLSYGESAVRKVAIVEAGDRSGD